MGPGRLRLGRDTFDFRKAVLYEDEALLVVNKPAEIVTMQDNAPDALSLQDLAKQLDPNLKACHRLDKPTTGAVVFAKTDAAYRSISMQFERGEVEKLYWAITGGDPLTQPITVDLPLKTTGTGRVKPDYKSEKKSITDLEPLEQFRGGFQLLACRPKTGRRHQIRGHLAHMGMPIVHDELYSGPKLFLSNIKRKYRGKRDVEEQPISRGLLLHAKQITLQHPETGEQLNVEAPLPKNFELCLEKLRQYGF